MLFSLDGIRLVILTAFLSAGFFVMASPAISQANQPAQAGNKNEAGDDAKMPTETQIIQACVDETGVDGSAMAAYLAPCVAKQEKRYSDILAADYQRALGKVAAPKKLREAQQQWLKHKQQTCAFEGEQDTYPSVRKLLRIRCSLRLTLQRIAEIRPWIDRER